MSAEAPDINEVEPPPSKRQPPDENIFGYERLHVPSAGPERMLELCAFSDITILVGENMKLYSSHRVVLSNASPYFTANISPTASYIAFPTMSEEVFEVVLGYMYERKPPHFNSFTQGATIVATAEKFEMLEFRNIVLKQLCECVWNGSRLVNRPGVNGVRYRRNIADLVEALIILFPLYRSDDPNADTEYKELWTTIA